MRFAEAEKQYRELEARLKRGELSEDDFLAEAAGLRVIDAQGRRWALNSQTGRWQVYDGQQWVFAEPPPDAKPQVAMPIAAEPETTQVTAAMPWSDSAERLAAGPLPEAASPWGTRLLAMGAVLLLALGCLAGVGAIAWVFFLRGGAEPSPTAVVVQDVDPHQTYTPRPPTATYTATATPTPSRTPSPTITPIPTNTPPATPTSAQPPTATQAPTAQMLPPSPTLPPAPTLPPSATLTPTGSPSATAAAGAPVIYRVKAGDTLWTIATRYGITVSALAQANGLSTTAVLHVGQTLTIPVPGTTPATPTRAPTGGASATPTRTAAAGATATPSRTATAGPSATPKPTTAPTSPPSTLTGKIAFTVWNSVLRGYDLYVSRIDGTGRNMLGNGFRQPQFRADGNLLAVNGEAPDMHHLVTMDASGNNKTEVSEHVEDSYPTWRADGAIVAFSSLSYGDGQERLGIVNDMLGKHSAYVPIGQTEIRGSYPFWLADGRIVYHGCDFLGNTEACGLYWVGAGGGQYKQLTTHGSDTAPAGHGNRVVFMSSRDGNWEVYAINMDGSGLKRLTNNSARDGLPTWSPDGRSIAFVSNRDGAWAIWVMNADGGSQRKLFNLDGGYGDDWTTERISWAP